MVCMTIDPKRIPEDNLLFLTAVEVFKSYITIFAQNPKRLIP